jgi:mannose-6-phosphate isomerase
MMESDHRPWGYYTILADEADHKVKRIVVYAGKRLSLQRHRRRAEHWYLLAGEALVTLDGREIPFRKGEAMDIPRGAAHRLQNTGGTEAAFIEVQTGDYFGEDDIQRLADDYGRV